jgi:hypothetical protein
MAKHGDAKLLDLLTEITGCLKVQSTNIYDRCKARYEGLTTRWRYSLRKVSRRT